MGRGSTEQVYSSLLSWGEHENSALALYDSHAGRGYSRRELRDAVLDFGASLGGGRPLVFCFCSNRAGIAIGYLACIERSFPVGLFDAGMHPDLKRALVELYDPEVVICPEGEAEFIADGYDLARVEPATVLRRKQEGFRPLHPDLAVLLSTSGSTGTPKLVRLSRRNVFENARAIGAALNIGPDDRIPTSLPIPYSYGLSVLNSHLLRGAPVVLTTDRVTAAGFWKTFRETRCTCLAGIPYTYEAIAQLGLQRLNLDTLRTMTQAGGRLRVELVSEFSERMRERGGRFFVMYGQTEATARIAVLDPQWLPAKLGSIGKPIPGGALRLERGGRPVIQPKQEGELVYSGPNVMMGYATNPDDLARGDELGGELRTGDLGYFDEDGFFFVTARSSRFGKVLGLRMNLDEVEAMFGRPGQVAVLDENDRLVVCCSAQNIDAVRVRARDVAGLLRLHPRAFVLRPVPGIPLNAKGRPDYTALRSAAADRGATPTGATPPR